MSDFVIDSIKGAKEASQSTSMLERSLVLTSDHLLDAPAGYFDNYYGVVQDATAFVRNHMRQDNKSALVEWAWTHHDDDMAQDEAFQSIYSYLTRFYEMHQLQRSTTQRDILTDLVLSEMLGLSVVDPLWRDQSITEVVCNGPYDIQVEMRGELLTVPSIRFRAPDHLKQLIDRLYGRINRKVDPTHPLVKGRLSDKSRIFAVDKSVAPDGPNLNIRRHPREWWTPEKFVNNGTASSQVMTWLGNLIYKGGSVVVSGGSHAGKALTLDTSIQTPHGPVPLSDIRPGDEVLWRHGRCHVTHRFDRPRRNVMRFIMETGESFKCDKDHNWFVTADGGRTFEVATAAEIERRCINEKASFSIPVTQPVVFDQPDVKPRTPHPYLVGLYMLAHDAQSSWDATEAWHGLDTVTVCDRMWNGQQITNDTYDTIDIEQFVPALMCGSVQDRVDMIRGIVDSSGVPDIGEKTWSVLVSDPDPLIRLVSSVGGVASRHGRTGEVSRIVISAPMLSQPTVPETEAPTYTYKHDNPFHGDADAQAAPTPLAPTPGHPMVGCMSHDPSIASQPDENGGTPRLIRITGILPTNEVEDMACLTVDNPEGTFLIGDGFVTTHNTSMLNALSGFYRDTVRIVTLEDTLELKPNPRKLLAPAMECHQSMSGTATEVSMRDLVKASLQMRPDVLIVGEVTDGSAYDLVQALNTGHAGASTVHANSSQDTMTRLASLISQNDGVDLQNAYELISSAIDVVVSVKHYPSDGSRRIVSIDEVGGHVQYHDGIAYVPTTPIWQFVEGRMVDGRVSGQWRQVGQLSSERIRLKNLDLEQDLSWDELRDLSSLPDAMEES